MINSQARFWKIDPSEWPHCNPSYLALKNEYSLTPGLTRFGREEWISILKLLWAFGELRQHALNGLSTCNSSGGTRACLHWDTKLHFVYTKTLFGVVWSTEDTGFTSACLIIGGTFVICFKNWKTLNKKETTSQRPLPQRLLPIQSSRSFI